MPTVTIAFQGLMFFHTRADGSKHVAIVDATHHAHIGMVAIWHHASSAQARLIPLAHGNQIILNSPEGKVKTDTLYRDHVPPLRDYIQTGRVANNVENELPHHGTLAYLTLPAGDLTTWSTYENAAELTRPNGQTDTWCFARFVVLTPAVSPTQILVQNAQGQITATEALNSDDLIFITNTSPHPGPHFHLYDQLLEPGGHTGPSQLAAVCDQTAGVGQFTPAIENALKQHHIHAPNGDCGPTGP